MRMRRGPWLALLAAFLLLLVPCTATAQSQAELARSRTLFEQGLAHAEAGRWPEARQAFESALAITERPSILLNLATAQAETGALVESAASYRRFLEIATGRDQRRNRAEAQEALASIERRIAHLTIEPVGLAADDAVLVDERELARTELVAIALDPGAHSIVLSRGGRRVVEQSVRLGEGQDHTLRLRAPDLRPVRSADATTTTVPLDTEPHGSAQTGGNDDGLAIGLGVGLGVGALVIGAIIVGVVVGTSSPSTYQGNLGSGVVHF
ncbi:MAG: tetratricopeptide repeat protein [Sandaracinaceae bacterium]|nr:tetratricopeptide repeat protein [Sandaracinaceae bacterium]